MAKLTISDREVALVKGLFAHTSYNDQRILSVFSYLDRDINHREIGAIRRGSKPRYASIPAATAREIDELIYKYSKIAALADTLGFCEMSDAEAHIHKSVEIMKTAILVYNNNNITSRSETFIVLSVIAWTYVLHVRLRGLGISPVHKDAADQPVMIDGKEKLWELSHCINRAELQLTNGEMNNLKYMIAVRNEVEHRSCEDINESVQSKVQANALNFLRYVRRHFGAKFDFSYDLAFTIQLQSLTLQSSNMIKGGGGVAKSVAAVNALLETQMTAADYNDPDYAFRVYVVPKVTNNSRKADQAVSYSQVGSRVEVAIKHVERPKFRASEAIAMLREEGVPNVTSNTFTQAWKNADLKRPEKGLAIELGKQWFWYQEGIDRIRAILTQ